jgi:hypothetical protein
MGRGGEETGWLFAVLYYLLRGLNFLLVLVFSLLFLHNIYRGMVEIWHGFLRRLLLSALYSVGSDERFPLVLAVFVSVVLGVLAVVVIARRERGG